MNEPPFRSPWLIIYVHRSFTSNIHELTTLRALLNSALIWINLIFHKHAVK